MKEDLSISCISQYYFSLSVYSCSCKALVELSCYHLHKRRFHSEILIQLVWDRASPSAFFEDPHGFPGGSDGKESTCNAGDLGSIPVLGKSPGGGNGHPRQYSCLENPMDRGAWQTTVHGVTKSWTQLSN